jgi:hypothetical protein
MATIVSVNLELLEAKLKDHDWTWRMGSMDAYMRGQEAERALIDLARRFEPMKVAQAVRDYADRGCAVAFLEAVWPGVVL